MLSPSTSAFWTDPTLVTALVTVSVTITALSFLFRRSTTTKPRSTTQHHSSSDDPRSTGSKGKLVVDSEGAPWRLLCPGAGRQLWTVWKGEGEKEQREIQRKLREEYSASRVQQRHPSDWIYRTERRSREKVQYAVNKAAELGKKSYSGDISPEAVNDAVLRGILHLETVQDEDGHFPADYGGPMFLLPGYAICCVLTERAIPADTAREMRRYLQNQQNEDGGWAMHVEGHSTVFGTALNYVAYRILGAPAGDAFAVKARWWLRQRGGALPIPSWGKMWLALFGCYEWDGMTPIPPELWLLPWFMPMHPGRLWCFARTVYLPMCYLYATRPTPPASAMPLVRALREEIFTEDYDSIDWSTAHSNISPVDVYRGHTFLLATANFAMRCWERVVPSFLRQRAIREVVLAVMQEDEATNYICLGPVNKMLNLLVRVYEDGRDSRAAKLHWERVEDYLWVAEDGMKMQGYNGCQTWDAAFAVQAMFEYAPTPDLLTADIARPLQGFLQFLDVAQSKKDAVDMVRFYRSPSLGGWGFSTSEQGWIVSDCTAEALMCQLGARSMNHVTRVSDERMKTAVDLLLRMQNADGGWATCEESRGSKWLEKLNPSEVFGDIMIDYSHVECTSSVVKALAAFRSQFADYRNANVTRAIRRGTAHLHTRQRPDGSFKGFWAVCFTYGTWFAVEGLRAGGESKDSGVIRRACDFILSKQNEDGGWGETHLSCSESRWDNCESQVVQTAWCVLALLLGPSEVASGAAVKAGVRFLLGSQLADSGDWPQQRIIGSFNGNCGISYINFRSYFPMWALARYHNMFGAGRTK